MAAGRCDWGDVNFLEGWSRSIWADLPLVEFAGFEMDVDKWMSRG